MAFGAFTAPPPLRERGESHSSGGDWDSGVTVPREVEVREEAESGGERGGRDR